MTVGRIPVIEGGIQPTIFDAKGDLLTATANDTPARLAVGANNTSLVANSSAATGLEWQGAWTTWTPSFVGITVGNGTVISRYQQIGKTISFEFQFTMGTTSVMGSTPYFTLPVTAKLGASTFFAIIGDTGTTNFNGGVDCNTTIGYPYAFITSAAHASVGYFTSTTPMTWTTGDNFTVRGTYEAA
jgi:hypothetical protein